MKRLCKSFVSGAVAVLTVVTMLALLSGCLSSGALGDATANNNAGGTSAPAGNAKPVREGSEAPDFPYTTIDGTTSRLSEHQGSVVLINLWASWCGPCVVEMPDVNQLKQENPELVVLAVNVSDDISDAHAYINETGYDFTWIIDESGEISSLYPTDGIPYTIIVDKSGIISSIHLGKPHDPLSTYSEAIKQAG
jgi:thiol-disulfide isomerase/thioredoxin